MAKYSIQELKNCIQSIFIQIGCSEQDSYVIADVLVAAEARGIPSHGIIRIKDYLGIWKRGLANVKPDIKIIRQTPTTLLIDGDGGFGPVVGTYSMKLVIELAQVQYSAWAAVRHSNHYGIAGYYALMAVEKDMIGISMTNANPTVAPTFSRKKMLGTNPIAVAIPAMHEPPFVADFATSPIARGKLEIMEKKNQKLSFPLVQDNKGLASLDPSVIRHGGAIVPLGGVSPETGGHKGFCLSAIVDIFSAVFSGANFGPFVPAQVDYLSSQSKLPGLGLGHFFGAFRIDAFLSTQEFKEYMDLWIKTFREADPVNEEQQVIIPGDPERIAEEHAKTYGIEIDEFLIDELHQHLKKYHLSSPF